MKHVYFVRHGESTSNVTKIQHGKDAKLTERGVAQAQRVAGRLTNYPIERIIASPYERTAKTANPIAEALKLKIEYSELFIERRGPYEVHGRHGDDPLVQNTWKEISEHSHIPGWKHSDEENFGELRDRACAALRFLETLPAEQILVVSHGMFMKMIFAVALVGDKLDGRMWWDHFIQAKNVENTGIMHLQFTENYHKTGTYWKLISWNDHAHLDDGSI
jgi:broad specificity phosphatase PhoE